MTKTIIVTGISGSGSKKFCKKYAKQSRERVKIYHTGDMIEKLACSSQPKTRPENLLNLHPKKLESLRKRTFEQIYHYLITNLGTD